MRIDRSIALDQCNPLDVSRAPRTCQTLLEDLQGNILQPHRRRHCILLLIKSGAGYHHTRALHQWIATLVSEMVINSAWKEFVSPNATTPFCQLFITASGFDALGKVCPPSAAFSEGMIRRGVFLGDAPLPFWEPAYRLAQIDAMILLADDDPVRLTRNAVAFRVDINDIGSSIEIEERGFQQRRDGIDIEHFGFADGISQPVFFVEDVSPRARWSPLAGPGIVLVEELSNPGHFGSFLVYRKLEQDVALWNHIVEKRASALGVDAERAGALLVGRTKDGSPLVQIAESDGNNDFNYEDDPMGELCPIQSHVRRMNPRSRAPLGSVDVGAPRIVRRGITYGLRPDLHAAGRRFPAPRTGVGLLFLAYQASIESQFERLQRYMANGESSAKPALGEKGIDVDPLVGQPSGVVSGRTDETARPEDTVHLRGGEYFFAPSLTFLRELADGK
jgi:Dyp-type peroxidase family